MVAASEAVVGTETAATSAEAGAQPAVEPTTETVVKGTNELGDCKINGRDRGVGGSAGGGGGESKAPAEGVIADSTDDRHT